MNTVREVFGSMVFGDEVMRERLPRETYLALRRTIREGRSLGRENQALADVVASAMKDWAVEKGATHYTLSLIHIWVSGANSLESAPAQPRAWRANSMTATCIPRQMPR